MTQRDFFAYCTSLRLIELKAIGALSQVRHYRRGRSDLFRRRGRPRNFTSSIAESRSWFRPKPVPGAPATVLSRGDLFGASGALIDLPRDHSARARADLSVQCFRRSDFPELLRRVPSFFLFLSEKLANRLFQTTELIRSHSHALELTGCLANFDVITIYQTILHSKQTGSAHDREQPGRANLGIFFRARNAALGTIQPSHRRRSVSGSSFCTTIKARLFPSRMARIIRDDGSANDILRRQADEILINAIHMRDEFDDLRKRLRDSSAILRRKQVNLAGKKKSSRSCARRRKRSGNSRIAGRSRCGISHANANSAT